MIQPLPRNTGNRTRHRLGPRDHGRVMTLDEFERCGERSGWVAELIQGAVQMSPSPRPEHMAWQRALLRHLEAYVERRPDIINFVATDCDVPVPGRSNLTRPRPDLAAYRNYPKIAEIGAGGIDWDELCPVLVVEIISRRRPRKDTIRNRHLYWLIGGIGEYWVLDPRRDLLRPRLIVHRRIPGSVDWSVSEVRSNEMVVTGLLPEFSMSIEALAQKM